MNIDDYSKAKHILTAHKKQLLDEIVQAVIFADNSNSKIAYSSLSSQMKRVDAECKLFDDIIAHLTFFVKGDNEKAPQEKGPLEVATKSVRNTRKKII